MGAIEPVAVIGAGGHAKVVISTLQAAGYVVSALYDDDPRRHGQDVLGVRVIGRSDCLAQEPRTRAIIAIGHNGVRRQIAARFARHCDWATVIHPRAYVHPSARLGEGTVVFAGAVVQPDVVVGRHCIINTGATVDHDSRVGDFAHIAPGAHLAGGVRVGVGVLIGIGSVVLPGVSVGDWAIVGAGAVVRENVAPGATVVGVPARPVKEDKLWLA